MHALHQALRHPRARPEDPQSTVVGSGPTMTKERLGGLRQQSKPPRRFRQAAFFLPVSGKTVKTDSRLSPNGDGTFA
nr:hypothetical protein SHINE37_44126 [Rhizobiaceae bacterium]